MRFPKFIVIENDFTYPLLIYVRINYRNTSSHKLFHLYFIEASFNKLN